MEVWSVPSVGAEVEVVCAFSYLSPMLECISRVLYTYRTEITPTQKSHAHIGRILRVVID